MRRLTTAEALLALIVGGGVLLAGALQGVAPREDEAPAPQERRFVMPLPYELLPPTTMERPRGPDRGTALPILYLAFGALQIADVISTKQALAAGGKEMNPLFPIATRPALALSMKAATTAAAIYAAERALRTNRRTAIVTMIIASGVMAAVVTHNVQVAGIQRRLP